MEKPMKEFLRAKIFALSQYLEMLLSLILGLVIVILAGKLLMDVFNPQYIFAGEDVFAYYLETAMNLAIGVDILFTILFFFIFTPFRLQGYYIFLISFTFFIRAGLVSKISPL